MEQKRCISSFTLAELTAELKAMGQPGFRAKQIFHWVHQKLVTEFSAMTDQPKTLLAKLEETFYIAAPQIERRQEAKDGTVKWGQDRRGCVPHPAGARRCRAWLPGPF